MQDVVSAFNDWQRKDIERLKALRQQQEKKRLAMLSLLIIVGVVLCGLSYYYTPLIFIGGILALIGGISFGKLINITQ